MKKKWLLCIPVLFVGITVATFYLFQKKGPDCNNCHVVVIDADIFRADKLDCEKTPELTPNLCAIKNEFVRLNKHYSHTDLTRPGMASFLTATYPSSHQVWQEATLLDPNQPNLVSLLEDHGYQTAIIGFSSGGQQVITENYQTKIDTTIDDTAVIDELFDEKTFLYMYTGRLHYPYLFGQPITDIDSAPKDFPKNIEEYRKVADTILYENFPTIIQSDLLQNYIKKNNGSIDGIFTYFETICTESDLKIKAENFTGCWATSKGIFEKLVDIHNPEEFQFIQDLYDTRISEIDVSITNVIKKLKDENLWDKTIFVIRSDHGEEFLEHGSVSHNNNLYEELVHVPFWIHIPQTKGKIIDASSQTIDETPTILEVLGIKPHSIMQGKSIFDLPKERVLIAQKSFGTIYSITKNNIKLIGIRNPETNKETFELYNLVEDPMEKNNIIQENQKLFKQLYVEYHNTIQFLPKFQSKNTFIQNLTEEEKVELFKDGYF